MFKFFKTRAEKAKKHNVYEPIFGDRTPSERQELGILEKIMPRVLEASHSSVQSGHMLDLETLFRSMKVRWPRLRGNLRKLREQVQEYDVTVVPWADKGIKPDETAQAHAKIVEDALFKATPEPNKWELDLHGAIGALAEAPERGVGVLEIIWDATTLPRAPKAFCPIPATFYRWSSMPDQPDKLVLCPNGSGSGEEVDFPQDKFLVALNFDGLDHPIYGANLLALVGWFGATIKGLGWFMQFCQLFGLPLRVGTADTPEAQKKLFENMQKFGQTGVISLLSGTTIDIKDATKSGAQIPHVDLLHEADLACDILILGQTLTANVSSAGGNRALGEVHENTEDKVVKARARYVGNILTQQLVPAILRLNLGTVPDHLPRIVLKDGSSRMSMQKVEYVKALTDMIDLTEEQVYDILEYPVPEEGAKLYQRPVRGGQEEADPFDQASLIHASRKKKA